MTRALPGERIFPRTGGRMSHYSLYCLDDAGRISGAAERIVADSDQEAIEAAVARNLGRCELWQGRRLVGNIEGPDAPSG